VKILRGISRVLLVLWAGSLWSLLWVASILFDLQSDRHLAGLIAARLFSIETYLGVVVAAMALLSSQKRQFAWGYLAALLLALNEWILKPIMTSARDHGVAAGLGFGAWHGISAVIYLLACCAVLVLIWLQPVQVQFAKNG
jgi:Domain of unknown function (DUF4149)